MGVQSQNSSERLRTIWTPEMDRYFIELMLDQLKKGKRVDNSLFSKWAWKHMTSLFNAKFSFHHEKDVLKNRNKTLRNLYRGANNLLDQEGFSWDEARQMITADNDVWDAYIKEHPDVRSYRIKAIPYYSDLCLIYEDGNPEGKGKHISDNVNSDNNVADKTEPLVCVGMTLEALHDIMIAEDHCIPLTTGNNEDESLQNVTGSSLNGRSRTRWHPSADRYFIDLMLEQVQKGNQVDGVFRKQAWVEMIASFNSKFGLSYHMDILRNRHKTLKRQYNVLTKLLEIDGFVWDDTRLMVTADDHVWQDYIKTHTDARQFMTRPVPYYKDLCTICKDPSINIISGQNPDTLVLYREDQIDQDVEGSTKKRRLEQDQSIAPLPKIITPIEGGGTNNNNVDEAESVQALPNPQYDDDDSSCSFSMGIVVDAVQALPEMDDELILDACDFLEDEKKAKMFLALNVKLRKKWLIRKLRPKPLPSSR